MLANAPLSMAQKWLTILGFALHSVHAMAAGCALSLGVTSAPSKQPGNASNTSGT